MLSHRAMPGVALVGLFALASVALPEAPSKDTPAPEDKQVVSSKAVRLPAATSVNFRKALHLPFHSLSTLGARIDAARRAPDPVALAHAASELAVAESVSGKQASLTSTTLLKESAELAKLRRQAAELQAVQRVAQQIANQDNLIADVRNEIAGAEAQAKIDTEAYQQNLEPTWTPRKVVVNNYTTQYLTIYINGNYKTEVAPGLTQLLIVEHRWKRRHSRPDALCQA